MGIHAELLLLSLATYFVGAIPFGLLVAKSRGIDPRVAGSKNIGATNVGRLLGVKYFFVVFFLDFLKSMLPTLLASYLVARQADQSMLVHALWLLVGFAAVLGHTFPVYLNFKGGKGVATSAGVMFGLYPYFTLAGTVAVVTFVLVFFTTRYVSLGSMLGAAAFCVAYVAIGLRRGWPIFGDQLPLLLFAIAIVTLIVVKHKANITRLLAGTEPKMGRKPAAAA